MPLASDGRSNTFPIGAALDFTSTTPLTLGILYLYLNLFLNIMCLDQNAERLQFSPPPMLHLLNSDGQLLPYAIISLTCGSNQKRPALNKFVSINNRFNFNHIIKFFRAPEPIQIANARFGQPPPGWTPPLAVATNAQPQNVIFYLIRGHRNVFFSSKPQNINPLQLHFKPHPIKQSFNCPKPYQRQRLHHHHRKQLMLTKLMRHNKRS